MAAAALGKHRVLGVQFHALLVLLGGLSVAAHAHVAGGHAAHAAVGVEQHFGAGKPGVDFNAKFIGLAAQPAADVGKTDDIIAVVLEAARQQHLGHLAVARFRQQQEAVFADCGVERRPGGFPVGNKFADGTRVHHRTGQDMRADFRAFFYDADADLHTVFRGLLFQADGRGQAGGAATDDEHIVLHGFALACGVLSHGVFQWQWL